MDPTEPAPKSRWADLYSRIISAIVLAAVGFTMIVVGVGTTEILVGIGCGIMGWEWRRISGSGRRNIVADATAVACAALPALFTYLFSLQIGIALALGGTAIVGLLADSKTLFYRRTLPGLLAIAIAGAFFVYLRQDFEHGLEIALWLPLTVIATDVGAYFAGKSFGGPKLAPKLSPNKTISGALGGQIAGVIMGVSIALIAGAGTLVVIALMAWITAIISQVGDLTESWAKRIYGVKDTSSLIPGHGGLLDRFDGLIAASLFMGLVTLIAGSTIFAW